MITLNLTQAETSELLNLLDAGVRSSGLSKVKGAAVLVGKIEQAMAPKTEQTESNVVDLDEQAG